MKTELTFEQSQRLIELGVNPRLASNLVSEGPPIFTGGTLRYKIFALADLLGLLPKKKTFAGARAFLDIYFDVWCAKWCVRYLTFGGHDVDIIVEEYAPELIDALYDLTLWCIENKYIQQRNK